MAELNFKAIHASLRPGRVAILLDKNDADWQHSCLRVIEFYSRVWGGAFNIIVPSDGKTIDERFWRILEAFDPDYIFRYQKSGADLRLSHPDEYEQLFQEHLRDYVAHGFTDSAEARRSIDENLRKAWISGFHIEATLHNQLKSRLAPFFFEDSAVDAGALTAESSPGFPLTDLTVILPNTEHQSRVALVSTEKDLIPELWYSAVTGSLDEDTTARMTELKIVPTKVHFGADTLSQLIEFVVKGTTGGLRAFHPDRPIHELAGVVPYHLSMLQLGLYRSTKYEYWREPMVLVAGNSFEDFCFYYSLSRLRDRVVWILPSITDKALGSKSADFSPAELHFLFDLRGEQFSTQREGHIGCVSYSLSHEQIDSVIEQMTVRGVGEFRSPINRIDKFDSLLRYPLAAVERDNFQRDIPLYFDGDRSITPFNTPKPKHFNPIHPYEHRYITQLAIPKEAPPKHFELGNWIVSGPAFTTHEVRVGKDGPAYFCPNVAYFGGDIDTVLVRPTLYLPSLQKILQFLATREKYECRPSDKGIYADDSIAKIGDLLLAGNFFRSACNRALLDQYMDKGESSIGKGVYLSDRRRYLDMIAIQALVGDEAADLVDGLVLRRVLYRGFILGCKYCRDVSWFSIDDLTHEFRCRRCSKIQMLSKESWRMPEEPAWFYKLDELFYQGYRQGMAVSVLALDFLRKRSKESFTFTSDREFWKKESKKPEIEVDFFCASDGILAIGEAKKEDVLAPTAAQEAEKLRKYRTLISRLSVRRAVFATSSESWRTATRERINTAFKDVPQVDIVMLDASQLLK